MCEVKHAVNVYLCLCSEIITLAAGYPPIPALMIQVLCDWSVSRGAQEVGFSSLGSDTCI